MDCGNLHIVMFPWLALGHILPFLELSKQLAQRGHQISFLRTPRNIKKLPRIPPNLSPLINLIGFPLPTIENLPETAEATIDLPSDDQRQYLKKAYDTLETNLSDYLQDSSHPPVDWVVYDYAAYWAPQVCSESAVPCSYLSLFNAAVLNFWGPPSVLKGESEDSRTTVEQFIVAPKWVPFPSTIAFKTHEITDLLDLATLPDASGVTEGYRFAKAIEGCDFVAVRSCTEFEPEWLQLLGKVYQKLIIPIGMLPPMIQEDSDEAWDSTFKWLDEQEKGSVVYAAFGSEAKLTNAQVEEIALGLELSQLPFVWAFRGDKVPEGFNKRIEGRGVVCTGWVPQTKVLAHSSVGGFLTHGGWNSIVEGLAFGRAIVVLPLMFDQGLNARNLVERQTGVEVERNEETGEFNSEGIMKSLRLVMVEKDGEVFRAKANESKGLFGDKGMQDRYLDAFIKHLWDHKAQKKAPSTTS